MNQNNRNTVLNAANIRPTTPAEGRMQLNRALAVVTMAYRLLDDGVLEELEFVLEPAPANPAQNDDAMEPEATDLLQRLHAGVARAVYVQELVPFLFFCHRRFEITLNS